MSKIYTAADQLIGHTPLLELTHIEKEQQLPAHILAKLEYFNPAGSVKDRIAKKMIDDAEAKGLLKEGSVIIEPTSGNTGIGLASVAAARGYRIIIVMPETMSVERRQIMKAYGAKLVLSEGAKGMKGAIAKADELAKEIPNSFIPGQFLIVLILKFSKITFCKLIYNVQLFSWKKNSGSLGASKHWTCIYGLYSRIIYLFQPAFCLRAKGFVRSFSYVSF